jgi:hypothetical protein
VRRCSGFNGGVVRGLTVAANQDPRLARVPLRSLVEMSIKLGPLNRAGSAEFQAGLGVGQADLLAGEDVEAEHQVERRFGLGVDQQAG